MATHYDNLKVRRDAPLGVIKASYRKLSQKYHPDRNPDPKALEIMKMINQAWDVLSDPERRAMHDRAIAELEQRNAAPSRAAARPAPAPRAPRRTPAAPAAPAKTRGRGIFRWFDGNPARVLGVIVHLLIVIMVIVFQFSMAGTADGDETPVIIPATAEVPPVNTETDRIPHGYLTTSAQDESPGIALVEIDNTFGGHDAEVRLFINGRSARSMQVHRGKRFRVENLAPGTYVVKYKVVVDGKVFAYQERELFRPQRGIFSKMNVRLFNPVGSKTTADRIAAEQF